MSDLLSGAYDLHVHAAPDVMPRSRDIVTLHREACDAGMAGMLFKDHCFPTHAAAFALNASGRGPTRAFGAIALNPTVGGINPLAVEAALRAGVDLVYFPTYASEPHLRVLGTGHLPMPLPEAPFDGLRATDSHGAFLAAVDLVLRLVKQYDAAVATGHLSASESLAVVERARSLGITRIVLTHASEAVPGVTINEQREAARAGALIEHCFLATTDAVPGSIAVGEIVRQTQAVGAQHVILSSDFGKESLGSPAAGFRRSLESALAEGLSEAELDHTVRENPRRLLVEGRGSR